MKAMNRLLASVLALGSVLTPGCARGRNGESADGDFHTSGSREADQRAEQRISKEAQLRGEGEGGDAKKQERATLHERLGGEAGIQRIVADFVDRAIADPRANWERKGRKAGGVLGLGSRSAHWKPTEEHVARLEKHLSQFIAVATGGPTQYDGRGMDAVHSGMKITNAEFDASIGALKASLDAPRKAVEASKDYLLSKFGEPEPGWLPAPAVV